MMKRIMNLLLFLLLTGSLALHCWEYRKIEEYSQTFALQAQIETKRTALMVLYQEVLINLAKELDSLRKQKTEKLELEWKESNR
ncbi:MAG: hypothetical protein IJH79_14345 [Lentisphaeria bacterium]|nr:hypothetical protein [Lentisphaeria bacterium]